MDHHVLRGDWLKLHVSHRAICTYLDPRWKTDQTRESSQNTGDWLRSAAPVTWPASEPCPLQRVFNRPMFIINRSKGWFVLLKAHNNSGYFIQKALNNKVIVDIGHRWNSRTFQLGGKKLFWHSTMVDVRYSYIF